MDELRTVSSFLGEYHSSVFKIPTFRVKKIIQSSQALFVV